jgi:LmbE family N-acetylglucosaminyl deacetylase
MSNPRSVKHLGAIVGIWAHPDDESFMMAGLMAAAVQNGQTVVCITATKGEKGSKDQSRWPLSTLGEVRAAELEAAFEVLGVRHHHWLDYADGECSAVPEEEAIARIGRYLEQYQPDTVITFPPDGLTGHPDHVAVSRWAGSALKACRPKMPGLYYGVNTTAQYDDCFQAMHEKLNIYFNVQKPCLIAEEVCDLRLDLTGEQTEQKCRALKAMPSQMEAMFDNFDHDFIKQALRREFFVKAGRDISWATPGQK